jgi:hypothetical protein
LSAAQKRLKKEYLAKNELHRHIKYVCLEIWTVPLWDMPDENRILETRQFGLTRRRRLKDLSFTLLKYTMVNVHVHRPPAVTLNETPEEFHIFTGLCQKI